MKYLISLIFICLMSCSLNENITSSFSYPVATETQAKLCTTELKPDLARALATSEYAQRFSEKDFYLAKTPVFIYSDSELKYFEFLVFDASTNIPYETVTTKTKKTGTSVILYVLPFIQNYPVVKEGKKIFIDGTYPNLKSTSISARGEIDTPNGIIDVDLSTDSKQLEFLQNLTNKDLLALNIQNKNELIQSMLSEIQQEQKKEKQFWDSIDEKDLLLKSDKQLKSVIKARAVGTYLVSSCTTSSMLNTRWNGWCVPSAISWVATGLMPNFNGFQVPLFGQSGFETNTKINGTLFLGRVSNSPSGKGFYNYNDTGDLDNDSIINMTDNNWVLAQSILLDGLRYYEAFITGNCQENCGRTSISKINNMMKAATDGEFSTIYTSTYLLVHSRLKNKNLPVFLTMPSHIVVAIGSKDDDYYYIHDNGNTTSDHNYSAYWAHESEFDRGGFYVF